MSEVVQLNLLNNLILPALPQAPEPEMTNAELWKAFQVDYEAIKFYPGSQTLVHIPNTETIAMMGRKQVKRFPSSKRLRQDCDNVNLMAKVAWSRYLGEPAHQVFDDWADALHKGNKGIFWSYPVEAVGNRATGGDGFQFTYSLNKYHRFITAHTFAQVQSQHNGTVYVTLLGWSQLEKMAPHVRERGNFLQVNANTLISNGLMNTPADFKQAFLNGREG